MKYVLLIALVFTLCASLALSDVASNFDDGSMDGWTAVGDIASITNPGAGGNPGGYLLLKDADTGGTLWAIAPAKFLGNWQGKSTVSVDLAHLAGSVTWSNAKIRISGPGGTYTRDLGERPPSTWKTYNTSLQESLWTRSSGSWTELLSNVTDFRVLMEYVSDVDVNALDNVRLLDAATNVGNIGLAKQLANGQRVSVSGTVSRILSDCTYIQSPNYSSGIRLQGVVDLEEGSTVIVAGTLATLNCERLLQDVIVSSSVPGTRPRPLLITSNAIGGIGATSVDPALGTSNSLKNTGLLVSVCGIVTTTNTDGTFLINDGGSVLGKCTPEMATPVKGAFTVLTGVSSAISNSPPSPVVRMARDECRFLQLPLSANLIRNGGSEEGPCGLNGSYVTPIPGWTTTSTFTVCNYDYLTNSSGIIYPVSESTRLGGGRSFFFGGENSASQSIAYQDIDVSSLSAQIDGPGLKATLSGYLGGRDTETDYATVTATYYSSSGATLGTLTIGPQAASNNAFVYHENTGTMPTATRKIRVQMKAVRIIGKNADGFFENLSLVLFPK